MVALRPRPKGRLVAPFGLCTFAFALFPAPIGMQDLVALFARKAAAAEYRQPALASLFGTIHPATFSFPRPVGAAIPTPFSYRLASLDPRAADATGSIAADGFLGTHYPDGVTDIPQVNRRNKGDRLAPVLRAPETDAEWAALAASPEDVIAPPVDERVQVVAIRRPDDATATSMPETAEAWAALATAPEGALPPSLAGPPAIASADPPEDGVWPVMSVASLIGAAGAATQTAGLYFGVDSLNAPHGRLEWNAPQHPFEQPAPELESDLALPAMHPEHDDVRQPAVTSRPSDGNTAAPETGGETIASKGEVTGKDKRPRSPAERLNLTGMARAKAEKCLTNAVYFEARGEPVRGQIAVAQVVMNRVFSQFYPDEVCAVVYQNAHRKFACQFTFACDNVRDVVDEPEAWERAKRIAKDTLDGKLWLTEVGKATHYHAYWVHPWWVGTMRKLHRIGVHTFYRPKRWGDGADEPVWGSAKMTAEIVKKL